MPVAEVDYERPLAAMWHEFRAAQFRVPQSVEIDPSVVAALLNARYYDPAQGQFLTEDPIFLSSSQNLSDPQSLNAYSYSEDNPITKEDPGGRCLEDGCVVEGTIGIAAGTGFVAGVASQYTSDVIDNIDQNGFGGQDFISNLSSPQTYLASGVKGATIGVASGVTVLAGGGALAVGATAAATDAIYSAGADYFSGQPANWGDIAADSALTGLTSGALRSLPQVPGRLPDPLSEAYFLGAHTQRVVAENAVSLSASTFFSESANSYNSYNSERTTSYGGAASGGGSSPELVGLYQSLVSTLTSLVGALSAGKH